MKGSKIRSGEINGFLDRTTVMSGELRFADTMRIDGRFSGRIISDNVLIVGETAEIDAEIDVAAISVMGRVAGVLRATSRVEVHPGGALLADIATPVLRIEEGAIFQGRCDMNIEERPSDKALLPRLALVEDGKK